MSSDFKGNRSTGLSFSDSLNSMVHKSICARFRTMRMKCTRVIPYKVAIIAAALPHRAHCIMLLITRHLVPQVRRVSMTSIWAVFTVAAAAPPIAYYQCKQHLTLEATTIIAGARSRRVPFCRVTIFLVCGKGVLRARGKM